MLIQEANEKAGDLGQLCLPDYQNWYCLIVNGTPIWYENASDHVKREVFGKEAIREDWEVFQRVEEVRPEKAGELWATGDVNYMTQKIGDELRMIPRSYDMQILEEIDHFIHGVGCYKRLFPKVEDDSVERIEIEDVVFLNQLPIPEQMFDLIPLSVRGIPVKVILEIPKDKP